MANLIRNDIVLEGTLEGIEEFKKKYGPIQTDVILYNTEKRDTLKQLVMDKTVIKIRVANASLSNRREHFTSIKDMEVICVAEVLRETGDFKNVLLYPEAEPILCMRQRSGDAMGTYRIQEGKGNSKDVGMELRKVIRRLNPGSDAKFRAEVKSYLEECSEQVPVNTNDKLVFCNNGIFDFAARDRGDDPFTAYDSPDFDAKYGNVVTLRKMTTNYNPLNSFTMDTPIDAGDGYEPWTLRYHLASPYENEVSAKLFLEICQFAIRGISGGMGWWFMNAADGTTGSAVGGGGKTGQAMLIVNLLGEKYVMHTGVDKLCANENYSLGELPDKMAIVSYECDASTKPISNCSIYKSLTRCENIPVRQIYQRPMTIPFRGLVLQCINGVPRFMDKSDSLYRCVGVLRFDKEFSKNGKERKYINNDYLHRKEVLECFLKYLLDMPCLDKYTPEYIEAIECNKQFMREASSPVFQFMSEIEEELESDFVPMDMLWDMFKVWEKRNKIHYEQEKQQFKKEVDQWLRGSETWENPTKRVNRLKAAAQEPLLKEFYLPECDREVGGWIESTIKENWAKGGNGTFSFAKEKLGKTYSSGIQRRDTAKTRPRYQMRELMGKPDYKKYRNFCIYMLLHQLGDQVYTFSLDDLLLGKAGLEDIIPYDTWVAEGKKCYDELSGLTFSTEPQSSTYPDAGVPPVA